MNKTKKQNYQTNQNGTTTIYLTMLGTLLLAITFGATILLQTIIGSYKASHAADLAALAAADTLNGIHAGNPCEIGQKIVENFGAVMVYCQLLDDNVIIETKITVWNKKFSVNATAKAGQP